MSDKQKGLKWAFLAKKTNKMPTNTLGACEMTGCCILHNPYRLDQRELLSMGFLEGNKPKFQNLMSPK